MCACVCVSAPVRKQCEIMGDPVIAADGHSYERKAIKKWFKVSLVSPKTGVTLSHGNVTRNFTLRAAINSYVNQQLRDGGSSSRSTADRGATASIGEHSGRVAIELTGTGTSGTMRLGDDKYITELSDDDDVDVGVGIGDDDDDEDVDV